MFVTGRGFEPLRLRYIAPALGGVEPLSLKTRTLASISIKLLPFILRLPIPPSSLKKPTYSHEPAGINNNENNTSNCS